MHNLRRYRSCVTRFASKDSERTTGRGERGKEERGREEGREWQEERGERGKRFYFIILQLSCPIDNNINRLL